jgi:hypothetical protein
MTTPAADKLPKPAPRGMTSCIYHIDDMCFPAEVLIFEQENVKFSRVDAIKMESGIYVGLEKGEAYAVDLDCEGRNLRFYITFLRKNNAPRMYDDTLRELVREHQFEESRDRKYFPDEVRRRILQYLNEQSQQRG